MGYNHPPVAPVMYPPTAAPQAAPIAASATANCQQMIAQAAYPVAQQMLAFAQAANAYPTGPAGRPLIAPPSAYPGFQSIYSPFGGPGYQFAGLIGAASLANLAAAPGPILPTVTNPPNGTAAELIGNVFTATDVRQTIIGNRLAAAELNATLTAFPREQAALLKEVIEGLELYRNLACPSGEGNGAEAPNGNGAAQHNGNGNGVGPGERP